MSEHITNATLQAQNAILGTHNRIFDSHNQTLRCHQTTLAICIVMSAVSMLLSVMAITAIKHYHPNNHEIQEDILEMNDGNDSNAQPKATAGLYGNQSRFRTFRKISPVSKTSNVSSSIGLRRSPVDVTD